MNLPSRTLHLTSEEKERLAKDAAVKEATRKFLDVITAEYGLGAIETAQEALHSYLVSARHEDLDSRSNSS